MNSEENREASTSVGSSFAEAGEALALDELLVELAIAVWAHAGAATATASMTGTVASSMLAPIRDARNICF
jgi:hypothetical protein